MGGGGDKRGGSADVTIIVSYTDPNTPLNIPRGILNFSRARGHQEILYARDGTFLRKIEHDHGRHPVDGI